jgi:hypothetical protein
MGLERLVEIIGILSDGCRNTNALLRWEFAGTGTVGDG